jgi:hypothetical protein
VAPTPHARQTSRTVVWVEEMRFDGLAYIPFWLYVCPLVSALARRPCFSRDSRFVASHEELLFVGTFRLFRYDEHASQIMAHLRRRSEELGTS